MEKLTQFIKDRMARSRSLGFLGRAPTSLQIVVAIGATLAVLYQFWFTMIAPTEGATPERWGQFGDYIGGLLNPVVGIASIYLLVDTLKLQQESSDKQMSLLKKQQESIDAQARLMVLQTFEQTLFKLLEHFEKSVSVLEHRGQIGVSAIRAGYNAAYALTDVSDVMGAADPDLAQQVGTIDSRQMQFAVRSVAYRWSLDNKWGGALGCINKLIELLDWIDQSPVLTDKERRYYVELVRMQIDWPILVLLHFFGIEDHSNSLARLVKRYALFASLRDHGDKFIDIITQIPYENFPENSPIHGSNLKDAPYRYTRAAFWADIALKNWQTNTES